MRYLAIPDDRVKDTGGQLWLHLQGNDWVPVPGELLGALPSGPEVTEAIVPREELAELLHYGYHVSRNNDDPQLRNALRVLSERMTRT